MGGIRDIKGYNPVSLPVKVRKINIAKDNIILMDAKVSLPLPNSLAIITEPIIIKT